MRLSQEFPVHAISSPANAVINGRIALKDVEIAGSKAEISVWGRNLADRDYMNSNLLLPFGTAINLMPARTYGVELSLGF